MYRYLVLCYYIVFLDYLFVFIILYFVKINVLDKLTTVTIKCKIVIMKKKKGIHEICKMYYTFKDIIVLINCIQ